MHANKFVMSNKEWTHTPHLLSRVTDDGLISSLLQPVKDQYFGSNRKIRHNAFQTSAKIYLRGKNILRLSPVKILTGSLRIFIDL